MIPGGGSRSRNRHGSSGDPHDIVSVTDDGNGSLLFTTAAPHGLSNGSDTVLVRGTSHSAYNTLTPVDETPTPTTFVSYEPYDGDSTGGVWLGPQEVSIADDGSGNALATLTQTTLDGQFVQFTGTTDYDGVWQLFLVGGSDYNLIDPATVLVAPFVAPSTGGTWASVTQYGDTYTSDQTLSTAAWVSTAIFEATGAGGDGDVTTGGGGGGYAKSTLAAPFPASLLVTVQPGNTNFSQVTDEIAFTVTASNGSSGDTGGLGGTGGTGDILHSGGNGGRTVGGGGGGAGFVGDGGGGGDGDGGTSSAVGGGGGGDGNDGGGYLGDPDDTGSNGNVAGGGGSAGGAGIPGTGATGIVVVTHYELT